MDLVREGKTLEAIKALEDYLKLDEGNTVATKARDELKNGLKRLAMIDAGDTAFTNSNWTEALGHYRKAMAIQPSDELSSRINGCLYQVLYAEAKDLWAKNKYDEAIKAFTKCIEYDPTKKVEIEEHQALIIRQKQYYAHITAGDAALADKDYSSAKRSYKDAEKILSEKSDEVKSKIKSVVYQESLAKSKEAMSNGDLIASKGHLGIAANNAQTEEERAEVKKLRADVERLQ